MFPSLLPQMRVCVCPIPPKWISEEQLTWPTALSGKYSKPNEEVTPKGSSKVLGNEGKSRRGLCYRASSQRNKLKSAREEGSAFPPRWGKSPFLTWRTWLATAAPRSWRCSAACLPLRPRSTRPSGTVRSEASLTRNCWANPVYIHIIPPFSGSENLALS